MSLELRIVESGLLRFRTGYLDVEKKLVEYDSECPNIAVRLDPIVQKLLR